MDHPSFSNGSNDDCDIALIQLKEPVINGQPARLYRSDDENGKAATTTTTTTLT